MVVKLTEKTLTATSILSGVDAVPVSALPAIWQQITEGDVQIGHPDPEFLVNLVRLFMTKAPEAKIFGDGDLTQDEATALQGIYGRKIAETLEFYGNDFVVSSYPNWDMVLETSTLEQSMARRVVTFVQDVFAEFGYIFPASFYWMLLDPVNRDSINESRPMAFDPRMVGVMRQYDAALHALNVTAVQLRIASIGTKHGLVVFHGCGCDHHLAQLAVDTEGSVSYNFPAGLREKPLVAFLWRMMNEFAFFEFQVRSNTLAL